MKDDLTTVSQHAIDAKKDRGAGHTGKIALQSYLDE
jgi:hypothetical protein